VLALLTGGGAVQGGSVRRKLSSVGRDRGHPRQRGECTGFGTITPRLPGSPLSPAGAIPVAAYAVPNLVCARARQAGVVP
jgi:hypothetical protein